MGHDPAFARRVETRWRDLRNNTLHLDSVYHTIDLLIDTLAEARVRNFERWPESERYHSYETEIQMLKQWISDRVDWIEANLGKLTSIQMNLKSDEIPKYFKLEQNYPNPSNAETTIKYHLSKTSKVTLSIYNLVGQKLITLIDEEKDGGFHQVRWDGKDIFGRTVVSGVYVYQIRIDNFVMMRKLLLLR